MAKELSETREQLQSLLNLKVKCILFFLKGFYYEHRDKSGKFLVRALKTLEQATTILLIKNAEGKSVCKTDQIASAFHAYYTKLYNLPSPHKPAVTSGDRELILQNVLNYSSMPTLSPTEMESVENPITADERSLAIKSLKPDKSPGPDGFTAHYYKTFIDLLRTPLL